MNTDDVIYLVLLCFSIGFGFIYRKIEDIDIKRNVGSFLGLLLVLLVSGWHTLHIFITVAVNAIIILYLDKRKCHVTSFAFSFGYLICFRTTIFSGATPGHTNLIEMILVLKMVGLALDVQHIHFLQNKDEVTKSEDENLEDLTIISKLGVLDIFHYSFNYCGILTGPYFRYRTYIHHLNSPYYKYDNYTQILIKKMVYLPMFVIFYLWGNYNWPLSYVLDPEFEQRSFLYRYWYIWPTFFVFRMRIYIGMTLSECACITAGLGVYPDFTNPKPGHGPTTNFQTLRSLLSDSRKLKTTNYNYETIHNIDPYTSDFCPTLREGMKNWNITVQYWMAVNVYKRFPIRKYRINATMIVSAIWHGVYAGYYVCIGTVPFGLIVEDIWVQLLLKDNTGLALQISKLVMLFLKMQLFSYQAIAFGLLEVGKIWKYYNSVYHCMLFFYVCLYFVGRYLLQLKTHNSNSIEASYKIK